MVLQQEPTDAETAQNLGWKLRDACTAGDIEEITRLLHSIDADVLLTPAVDKKTSLCFYVRKVIPVPVVIAKPDTQALAGRVLEKLQIQKAEASKRVVSSLTGSSLSPLSTTGRGVHSSSSSSTDPQIDVLCFDLRRGLDIRPGTILWEDFKMTSAPYELLSQVIAAYRGLINNIYRHPFLPITSLLVSLEGESAQPADEIPISLTLQNLKETRATATTGPIRIGYQPNDDPKGLNSLWRHSTDLKTPVWSAARLSAFPATWIQSTPANWVKPESTPASAVSGNSQYLFRATPTLAFAPPQIAPFPHPRAHYPPLISSHIDLILMQPVSGDGMQTTDLGEFARIAYFALDKAVVLKRDQLVPPLTAQQARRLLGREIQWRRPTSKQESDHDDVLAIGYVWGVDPGDENNTSNALKLFVFNSEERQPIRILDLTTAPPHKLSPQPPKSDTNGEKIAWVGIIPLPGSGDASAVSQSEKEIDVISGIHKLIESLRQTPVFEVKQNDTIIVGDVHVLRNIEEFPVKIPNAKPGTWISHVLVSNETADIPVGVEAHFFCASTHEDIYADLGSITATLTSETPGHGTDHLPWAAVGTFGVDAGGAGILVRSAFLPGGVCFRFSEQNNEGDGEIQTQILLETVGLAATDRHLTHATVPGGVVCETGSDGVYNVYVRVDEGGEVVGVRVPLV